MNILIALFLILFEAIPEALVERTGKKKDGILDIIYKLSISNEKGIGNYNKLVAGLIEFIYRAAVTIVVYIWYNTTFNSLDTNMIIWIIAGYILLRFAIFDLVYNLFRQLPIFYIGTSKVYDRIFNLFFRWTKFPPEHFLAMTKFCALIIGVTWLW